MEEIDKLLDRNKPRRLGAASSAEGAAGEAAGAVAAATAAADHGGDAGDREIPAGTVPAQGE